jgi:hypothetical protein
MNTHKGGNHEPIQQFDEVVSIQQQWSSTTLGYFIPITCVPAPTIIFDGLQNPQPSPNMDLVPMDSENGSNISIGKSNFIALTEDFQIN